MPFRARTLCVACLLLAAAQRTTGQELTERQAIDRLLATGPHARAVAARTAVIRAEARARTIHPNPTASYTREGAGLAEFLEIEQPLVITKRRTHLRDAGEAAVRASELEGERVLWELRSEVRLALA